MRAVSPSKKEANTEKIRENLIQIENTEPWEKKFGESIQERTQNLGHGSNEYRESVKFPPPDKESKLMHEVYIHHLGSEMLRAMFTDDQLYERERAIALKKQSKIGQLLRKRIKVTDFDDGGLNISMEQDWDTSSWNDTLVESAAEALVYIFYDLNGVSSIERKERAIQMLKKLMDRHTAAVDYIKKNLEMLMGKAASKLIRNGVSGGILNLLYVINSCKEQFSFELSNYNFAGRIVDMLIIEAKLAAILIQHTYRARYSKRKLKEQQTHVAFSHLKGFGTEKEVYYRRLRVINARSSELRYYWRLMHEQHPASTRQLTGGMRGPIHVGPTYLVLCLDIIRFLVSDNLKAFAHPNREDVVRAKGCILLSTYIGTMNNKFASYAVQVLAEIAKVAESLYHIIESGCIDSVVKYLRYLRTILGVGVKVVKAKSQDTLSPTIAYLSSLDIIGNAALHAAGVFRARDNYQCVRSAAKGVERTDYRQVLSTMKIRNGRTIDDLTPLLCSHRILKELSIIIQTSQQLSITSKACYCYLIILSCDGHHRALDEVTAGGAKLLLKIMSFLTHDDDSLATTALCIFQQLTCYESSRHAMSIINLPGHLLPLFDQITTATPSLKSQGNNASTQSQKKLYRLLLVMIFLARQKNWRLYDPELLYEELLQSDLNHLREIMYVYLLRIIKDQCFLGNNQDITRSDLLLLPSYALLSRAMGKVLINYPFHFLLNCLYHPENPIYYEACPLDETCTVCVILQSLVFYKPILTHVYSSKLVLYLSKFLFLCKYLFLGKSMTNRQIVLLFQGIKSAIIFLSEMIPVILYDEEAIVLLAVVKETELIDQSILFFLNTLQEFQIQKKLQEEEINSDNQRTQLYYTLQLQKEIGVCSIKFLTNYSKLVNHWHLRPLPVRYLPDSTRVSVSIQDLYPPAIRVVKTLRNLKNLYQDANKESGTLSARRASRELGSSLKEEFDFHNITGTLTSFYSNKNITFQFNSYRDEMAFIQDCLCSCLAEMTRTKGGAVAALQEWDVQNALRHHLPPPLSGLVFSNKTNQIPDPTTTLHIKPQQTAPAILTSALKSSTNDMNIISTGKKVTISSDTNLYPRPGSAQLTPNSNTSDNLLFSPLGKGLTINTDFSAMTPHRNKEYGSSIKSPHHAHNTAHPMKRTLTEVILQDESHANYRLQLMEIPSSFFELIAHLCFIEEGKIFCFADGFVRHALDKLTLIHTLLPTNQTNEVIVHYQQYQNQQRQQSKRLIMSASSSVSGSRSSSFLLSSAVKSPKNRLRSPQGTIASTPSSILSNSVPGSFDAEEARRGLKRAESMMSEGKDDDDYYRHIVDFAKHFRASFDQTQPAFHPQSAFTPSAVPRRGTNVTPGINVIHASNVMNTTLTPDEVFNWIHRKNDIIACLKIIKSIANFHHKHHGSANDIILSTSLYAIAAICKDLIKLHLPREDEVILLAYECLSELAKDTFRFHNPMEENHLLELARQEMSLSIDFPVRGLIAVVNMIRYACQGITSHYIVSMIPLLREPLLRVSRIFPQLSDDIRSANWMLTKSAMIFKSTVDPNYIVSNVQNITVEMEEFFRTGHLHKQTEMQVHPNAEINSRLENNHEDRNSALPISSEIKLPSTKHHHTSAGDYTYCGVESCGSLRFPDAPHNHGEYHHLSEDKRKEILQKLPLLEESLLSSPNQSERAQQYLMPLTKMTAQGKVLRDTLQIAKAKNGFTEIRAVKMNSDKRFTHKVYEDQNNSQGLTSQIRSISVTELPELKLTRPKMPK